MSLDGEVKFPLIKHSKNLFEGGAQIFVDLMVYAGKHTSPSFTNFDLSSQFANGLPREQC